MQKRQIYLSVVLPLYDIHHKETARRRVDTLKTAHIAKVKIGCHAHLYTHCVIGF